MVIAMIVDFSGWGCDLICFVFIFFGCEGDGKGVFWYVWLCRRDRGGIKSVLVLLRLSDLCVGVCFVFLFGVEWG